MRNLLDKYLLNRSFFAPEPGGGNGGAGGDSGAGGGGGGGAGDGDDGDTGGIEFDDDDEGALDDDALEILAGFKGKDDDDADDEVDDTKPAPAGPGAIPDADVTALETDIKNTIKTMKIPDALIPADFNPTDPAQFRSVMDGVVRTAVQQALRVVFKPNQMALTHVVKSLTQQMDTKISAAQVGARARDYISEIPGYEDPKIRPMIDTFNTALKDKGKKPQERAGLIKKMLRQMGMDTKPAASSSSEPKTQVRTGKAALDNFFPQF